MRFILPLPPTDNRHLIISRYGHRMVNSTEFRNYKKEATSILMNQLIKFIRESPDFNVNDFPLKLSFEMQYPINIKVYAKDKRRDPTNIQKSLFDCLKGIVINDDKWLLPRFEKISIDSGNPRVEISF